MIIVGDCLVSEDIIEKEFSCNLAACKGACCVEGDAGAPLEDGEDEVIISHLEHIKKEMDETGISVVEHLGVMETDSLGEAVTTCKPNKECVFAVRKEGSLTCAIEIANKKHAFGFPKPISCHLYPVRVKKYNEYYALNYHQWDICSAACAKGKEEGIKVFEFSKTALIRKFGEKWYRELEAAAVLPFRS